MRNKSVVYVKNYSAETLVKKFLIVNRKRGIQILIGKIIF